MSEVFNYEFTTTPDYKKLKFFLIQSLLNFEMTPNLVFDWSKLPNHQKNFEIRSKELDGSENVEHSANEFSLLP